ncbi:MAG: MBL fold metallo-hydrolase, partial [Eubacteriaceae bacterium]|nr:MBL fold metallo-hydrolase [Eubacteriaceae bacterium]
MKNVTWYGQGSLRIATDGKVIYTDPFLISKASNDADIILITHRHFDHLSTDDIEKVINDNTIIAAPADCVEEIKDNFNNEIAVVSPGEEYTINDIKIQTVRAYNIEKKECHPKGNDWLGYIINVQDGKYYYTGDSEKIPEMNALDVDV